MSIGQHVVLHMFAWGTSQLTLIIYLTDHLFAFDHAQDNFFKRAMVNGRDLMERHRASELMAWAELHVQVVCTPRYGHRGTISH